MTPLLAVTLASLAAWVYLVAFHGGFWRTDVRLPEPVGDPARWPAVAAVVPARDEAATLPATLPTLLAQRYPGELRVLLVDDESVDGTAQVAARLAAATPETSCTVLAAGIRPPGWTGKLWALQAGIGAAGGADLLLLTDADIAHEPDSLAALVRAAEGHRLDLVSQLARLRTTARWERLLVPAFVYFFALLYPFRRSNRPTSRTAAAAGGCTLVRRAALARAGGIAAIRGAVIDDVALARLVKRSGGRTWLGLAGRVRSVRVAPRLADLWAMVARSADAQLRHSPVLLAGTVGGLALTFLLPPAAVVAGLATGDAAVAAAGATAAALMVASYLPVLRYHGQPLATALLLPAVATLYLAMTVDSARRHRAGRGAAWKGRSYDTAAGTRPARR